MKLTTLFVTLAALVAVPVFAQAVSQTHKEVAAVERDRMLSLAVLLGSPLLPTQISQDAPAGKRSSSQSHASQVEESDGQRIFEQNCSRCHNAPEGFSPSIAGTIVRHMRVRASLSPEEEKELLHFFNP